MSASVRWFAGGLALVLVLAAGGTGVARAQEPLPQEPAAQTPPPIGPLLQAANAAVELTRLGPRLADIDRRLGDARARLAAVEATLAKLEGELADARARRRSALDRLRTRAADSYQQAGAPLDAVIEIDRLESLSRLMKYAAATAAVDNAEIDRIDGLVDKLSVEHAAGVVEQRARGDEVNELAIVQAQLAEEVAAHERVLQQVGGVTVMGESALTSAQMTAWFESRGQRANLPEGTSIADLARMFVEEGGAEHVRADVAFVQSVLETGFFRETRGNNYAGIGNCDSCGGVGMMFPTPREGVRAQIQLLRNYADGGSRAANLAHPPDPTLYGAEPVRAASRYDTFFLKGEVPLWNQMGNGNWATSTTYAAKVLGLYAQMLEFAGRQASGSPG